MQARFLAITDEGEMSGAHRQKVMVVDDDVDLVAGLVRLLEHEGYVAIPVTRGVDALRTALRERPDAIVVDVVMPGVDGREVLQRIRSNASLTTTPVMMLSAEPSVDERVLGLGMGAEDLLLKPFASKEFIARVKALLRQGGARPDVECRLPIISEGAEQEFCDTSEVLYIEARGNRCVLHTTRGDLLTRLSLAEIQERVRVRFMRVHRSFIVNLDAVRGCRWVTRSAFVLIMAGDAQVPVSRALVGEVRRRLGLTCQGG
ncbi:MAG: response regulator transcription factor [Coriobacteriales bacterium]|nr:response regulator transcription factor [Actinomycetes bacterium]